MSFLRGLSAFWSDNIISTPALRFRSFFTKPSPASSQPSPAPSDSLVPSPNDDTLGDDEPVFTGYLSDLSSEDSSSSSEEEADDERDKPPPAKRARRKLDVPARTVRICAREDRLKALQSGLKDIEKLIGSKRTEFDAGQNSLQAYRACAIQSHLQMVVNNKRKAIEASEIAAESQGFAAKWGGRMVQTWVRCWLKKRELPVLKTVGYSRNEPLDRVRRWW